MLQIVLFIAGFFAIVKGRIKVSNEREITKPYSYFLGIFLVFWAIFIHFLRIKMPYDVITFIIPLLVTIGFSFTGKKIEISQDDKKKNKKRTTIIVIAIFIITVISALLIYNLILNSGPKEVEFLLPPPIY
jgi:4-amino-4-deoxy-L-arabinose transferase-like glycosyltransferase